MSPTRTKYCASDIAAVDTTFNALAINRFGHCIEADPGHRVQGRASGGTMLSTAEHRIHNLPVPIGYTTFIFVTYADKCHHNYSRSYVDIITEHRFDRDTSS